MFYDEIEIEDMQWNSHLQIFYYPCPCGDRFQISIDELLAGEEIAHCPSCTLKIKVIYSLDSIQSYIIFLQDPNPTTI